MTTEESKKQECAKQADLDALKIAVNLVTTEIDRQRKKLDKLTNGGNDFSVLIRGLTYQDYHVELKAPSSKVASVLLRHDYPVWNALGLDLPDALLDDLAGMLGLSSIITIDLCL